MNILLHDYGGYAFTQQLGRALSLRGHAVRYLYSDSTQFVKRGGCPGGEGCFSARGIQLSTPFEKYSLLKRRAAEMEHGRLLAEEICRTRPDVVVSADTPLDAQKLAWQACRQVGARLVFWLQDAIGLAMRKILSKKLPLAGALVGHYYEQLERALVRQSERVVLISEDFVPLMDHWGVPRDRVAVIPNWAPLSELPPQEKANPWAVRHGLDDKFCLLYSGILGLKHDPQVFVRLAQHFTLRPEVRVVVVSEGGGADWLRQQQAGLGLSNLVLLPFQPAAEYPQVLGAADVLLSILSADAGVYSVPSKVLTYLCARRALLLAVPHENLAARTVEQVGAGLVAQPQDYSGICGRAELLLADEKLRLDCGERARRYAEEAFDISAITDRFERILCCQS